MKSLLVFLFYPAVISAQLLSWSPSFPKDTDPIKITVDATKGNKGLFDFKENVFVHIGVITSTSRNGTDWKYVPFTWGSSVSTAQAISLGSNKWQYSINTIRSFFNVPAGESIRYIAILFRSGNCTNCASQRNSDGSDMYIPIYDNGLYVRFEKPAYQPTYTPTPEPIKINLGESIAVTFRSSQVANLELRLNDQSIFTASSKDSIEGSFAISTPGNYTITGIANNNGTIVKDSFSFIVSGTLIPKPLPEGVRPGINRETGDTSIVLALIAPNKTRVTVIGDFPGSEWKENIKYQMNIAPDNKTWWLRIGGLNPTMEYAFQYLVDGTIRVTDPYVEKILDPFNDVFISSATYPNLKSYPSGKTNGIVGVISPRASYTWKNKFKRHDPSQLVIYELLLRDFLKAHDFNSLTDTLHYLKRLGINAIELMPVSEFEGNESWGYNPNFFCALDKYYGDAGSFKRFIDSCHGLGIAVIMDIVLNHATGTCPLASLYWDGTNQRPSSDNPWFNVTAKHPFNVFNDFNHESKETKYFSTRVMEYWLKEFNIDGYRFDLSKGFTQKNNPNDVNAWSAYDASRVQIWKEYHDSIQKYSQGAYTILEHFADNAEERELSDYGMMLWGNSNYNFNEGTMGYTGTSDFTWSLYQARNWSRPHLISYMESHDEERLMYKNQNFGNQQGAYTTRDKNTALERMKMAAAFFFMSPGPKMIWQFGELGYDYSINTCVNGSVNNNCRLDNKPISWNYLSDTSRKSLYDWYSKLVQLRTVPAWKNVSRNLSYSLQGAFKWMSYNTNEDLNVVVMGNFDVKPITTVLQFPKAGTWIDLYSGKPFIANAPVLTNQTVLPGEFHVYTDKPFEILTPTKDLDSSPEIILYPNPTASESIIQFDSPQAEKISVSILNAAGKTIKKMSTQVQNGINRLSINMDVPTGVYFIHLTAKRWQSNLKWVVSK